MKRKGAYFYPENDDDYSQNWNKDFSNLTAQKGVEACLLHDARPEDIIRCLTNPFDFMCRYKTPSGAEVYVGDEEQLKTVRYYVSVAGKPMKKVAAPKGIIGHFKRKNGLSDTFYKEIKSQIGTETWDARIHTANKKKYEKVTTGVESGWLVKVCNRASDFDWQDVNYIYYEKEIEKLLIGERNV